ncbi:MAG TPA: ribosome-associated translation inhibitor RaiA [Polyangiales bacterium]|nr:ribosome-associated translation inhibitor RaiA [Polyangiales bacterium]
MRIAFTFRNIDSSDSLKNYASEKLSKLQKFMRAPLDLDVNFSTERHFHQVEVVLRSDGHTYVATEQTEDMYASIDKVTDCIDQQVRRSKSAEHDRRRTANSEK